MSDRSSTARIASIDATSRAVQRGQSLVEFALVLPMLLVLLLGVADFGRVFSAGIVLEASARNAAEAAAQEYLQLARNAPSLDAADYQRIHDVALLEVCREAERLPEEVDADADGVCEMPAAAVCIHDVPADPDDGTPPPAGGDPLCGVEASGAPQPGCSALAGSWNAAKPGGADQLPHVEVRVCYRFTTLINLTDLRLPLGWGLSLGEIWLQKDRSFAVADY
jgi:hypothetical protein